MLQLTIRRRLQFSLASLLIFVTVLCFALGWTTSHARKKQQALAMLERLGASVLYNYQRDQNGTYLSRAVSPGNKLLKCVLGDKYASEPTKIQLCVDRTMLPKEFGDAEAEQIGLFNELTWLVLQDTNLTDAGLKHLVGLKKLRRLDAEGTAITEVGAKELERALPELEVCYGD